LKKRTKKLLHLDPEPAVGFVALLRGVNVGRANRIAMADLRGAVERLGYTDVRTLLNSGNVLFRGTGGDAEASISSALADLGVVTRVIVLPVADLRAILAAHPFPGTATDPARLLVALFAGGAPPPRVAALAAQDWGADRMALVPHAAFLWCAGGILESAMLKAFTRAAADTATMRNWTTMTKLCGIEPQTE
jgi:uncharacterized protein (DUF1697 family)